MHGSSLNRMRWFVENWLTDAPPCARVLDIGSCDVAGGTYKQFFPADRFEYVGLDLAPGPNVDIVPKRPYCWEEVPSGSFDVVVSGQAFEHSEFFWLTAAEMARALKPGGLLCLLAPRGFARHRYPVDCYRFDVDGMIAIARWCNLDVLHASTDMEPEQGAPGWHIEDCEDSLLVARKSANWPGVINPAAYVFSSIELGELQKGFRPCEKLKLPAALRIDYENLKNAFAELERRSNTVAEESERLRQELYSKDAELRDLRQQKQALERSNSWRLTRPLRALCKTARNLLHKIR